MKFRAAIFLLIPVIVTVCASFTSSQTPTVCPKFVLSGPSGIFGPTDTVSFEVRTANPSHFAAATVNWSVSAGLIVSGQGTTSIKYQSHVTGPTKVTVWAAVKADGCRSLLSDVWSVIGPIRNGDPIDDFGKTSRPYLQARIDNFYTQLSNNPLMEGAVIIRFDTHASAAYKRSWIERFMACLKFRKYDPSRITFLLEKETGDERTMFTSMVPESNDSNFYVVVKGEEVRSKLKDLFR